jgi:hypothetical protein
MRRVVWIVSIVSVLLFAGFAHAQMGKSSFPKFHSEFKPLVGGWSEYEIKTKGGEGPTKMKIAVVAKEGDAYWFETVFDGGREGKTISKMLVSGNPDDTKNVKRMIFKTGNKPAMEMPVQMTGRGRGQTQEPSGKVIDKGTETIKVPAGSFTAQHMQIQHAEGVVDSWIYKDVSPYGLIKSQSKDHEMVLIGYGTGAKTLITEQPRRFEMPKMPQMQMQSPPGGRIPSQPANDDDDDDDDDDEDED